MSNGNVIENRIRALTRRAQMTDFERGVLDEQLYQDERIEDLETQEFTQPTTGGKTLIERIIPGSVNSVTFSSIPATFEHIEIIWRAKSDNVNEEDTLEVQFNGDTTSQYRDGNHQIAGPTSTIHTVGFRGLVDSIQIGQITGEHPSLSDDEHAFGIVNIPHYANVNTFKMLFATSGGFVVSRAGMRHTLSDGQWEESVTAAIDTIKVSIVAGARVFVSNSVFDLYGLA